MSDAGYDDVLDAVEEDAGFYLACPDGHGSLPPRTVCPTCGSADLSREPLPATGTLEALTRVHVGTPEFAEEAPYRLAIARFGPLRLTGFLSSDATRGDEVTVDVARNAAGERHLVFE